MPDRDIQIEMLQRKVAAAEEVVAMMKVRMTILEKWTANLAKAYGVAPPELETEESTSDPITHTDLNSAEFEASALEAARKLPIKKIEFADKRIPITLETLEIETIDDLCSNTTIELHEKGILLPQLIEIKTILASMGLALLAE